MNTKNGFNFRPTVRKPEREYLIVGFKKEDFPPEVRDWDNVMFVPRDEVLATPLPSNTYVCVASAALSEDEQGYLKRQWRRQAKPLDNYKLLSESRDVSTWLLRELRASKNTGVVNGGGTSIVNNVHAIPSDSLQKVVPHESNGSLVRKGTVVVLGVNLVALPDLVNDERFTCLNPGDAAKLEAFPTGTQLAVIADQDIKPGTIQALAQMAHEAGIRVIRVSGGTASFKEWLKVRNIDRELDSLEQEKKPKTMGRHISPNGPRHSPSAIPVPKVVSSPEDVTDVHPNIHQRREATLGSLIKGFWEETGGSPKKLQPLVSQVVGYNVSYASITASKYYLLHIKGWRPPSKSDGQSSKSCATEPQSPPVHENVSDRAFNTTEASAVITLANKMEEGFRIVREGINVFFEVQKGLIELDEENCRLQVENESFRLELNRIHEMTRAFTAK